MDSGSLALLRRLKASLEDSHQLALHVLEQIEQSLGSATCNLSTHYPGDLPSAAFRRHQSVRDRVLLCVLDGPMDVDEIAAAANLSRRQVRGVLYAADIGGECPWIERMRDHYPMRFRLTQMGRDELARRFGAEKSGSSARTDEPPHKDSPPGLDNTRR